MFAGHIGVALAIGRVERRVNVGAFVAASLLLDAVLWLCVLLGWERVEIPADFARTHQPRFGFPFSHGLLAALMWSAFAAALAWGAWPALRGSRWRAAALLAAAVFSHWLLDALVHRPEMPLAGAASPMVGLGLWDAMPVALLIEAALAVTGLSLFAAGANWSHQRSLMLTALVLVVLTFTVVGMTVAPPPPSAQTMAASSLVTIAVVCGLFAWLGRSATRPFTVPTA